MMGNNHITAVPEAPMVTATPTNIGEVLRQLVDEAISKAAEQPDHLSDFFEQVEADANKIVDTVKRIPDNLVDQLEQPPFRPPDWWSLLVFALLRIRDLLDDDRLTVGYRHPAGWSRMVTLNFSESAADPDNTVAATLGIALTDPGVTHGLWLQVLKDFDMALGAGRAAGEAESQRRRRLEVHDRCADDRRRDRWRGPISECSGHRGIRA